MITAREYIHGKKIKRRSPACKHFVRTRLAHCNRRIFNRVLTKSFLLHIFISNLFYLSETGLARTRARDAERSHLHLSLHVLNDVTACVEQSKLLKLSLTFSHTYRCQMITDSHIQASEEQGLTFDCD